MTDEANENIRITIKNMVKASCLAFDKASEIARKYGSTEVSDEILAFKTDLERHGRRGAAP
jgi:hypothetical protein